MGVAVQMCHSLKLVKFDHKPILPEVVLSTGYDSILTVVDVVSRVTMFIPVQSKTAVTTA